MSLLKGLGITLLVILVYFLLFNPPIFLQAVDVGTLPQSPTFPPNLNQLHHPRFIEFPQNGVEDVEVDDHGNIYTAAGGQFERSSIYRIKQSNLTKLQLLGKSQGQVLGICLSPSGKKLALADQKVGLRLLDLKTGKIETLTKQMQHISINSLTFSDENTIYFTFTGDLPMKIFHLQLLAKSKNGKIYKHSIKQGKTEAVVENLHFPNGISYSKKDKSLYVNHLNKHQVLKIDLKTYKSEVVASNLPGFPDNLKINKQNKLWIALPTIRNKISDCLHNNPILRKIGILLNPPKDLFMALGDMSLVGAIKVNPKTGVIEKYMMGKSDQIKFVTGAFQKNGKLYLSSLINNKIAIIDL